MVALSLGRNLSWNPGKGPLCSSQQQELAMSLPSRSGYLWGRGVLRRTEMKLFLSARIHTPKPRITAPRICKERGGQRKPRSRWVRKLPEETKGREGG